MARVLVIDDSASARHMIRRALEVAGHRVQEAGDGRVGLRLQTESPSDLVITDLIMPEKEGLETIRDLRARWPDLAIIAISGGSASLDKESLLHVARCFGAVESIAKPFTADQITQSVSRAIEAGESRGPTWSATNPLATS